MSTRLRFGRSLWLWWALVTWITNANESMPTSMAGKRSTIIDFSETYIEGERLRPEGMYIAEKRPLQFHHLFWVRDHFLPELLQSMDDL